MRKPVIALTTGLAIVAAATSATGEPSQPYTPGLVEFMMQVQSHHAKLWLAGNARNWDLADYQVDELKELLEDTEKDGSLGAGNVRHASIARELLLWTEGGAKPGAEAREYLEERLHAVDEATGYDRAVYEHDAFVAHRHHEIMRGKADPPFQRRQAELGAQPRRQPGIGRRQRRPDAFVEAAENEQIGMLEPRLDQAPDGNARMLAVRRAHLVPLHQALQQSRQVRGAYPLRPLRRMRFISGQEVGRLIYERLLAVPEKIYGVNIGSSYQSQGLALSKQFKPVAAT